MSGASSRAIFLSYASQDAEAARRICETLRESGVEVWFDADGGLEHGDEWDAKIRRQIKECVLFIPLISANTQAREEGYFRLEWDLAAERARTIASGVPFILPVIIDDTREPDALVPDRFRMVQWTRVRGGELPADVKQRFLKLWSHRTGLLKHEATRSGEPATRPGFNPGRGLAAIVFTDVVGYSERMQRDETGTMALVKSDFARMREHCVDHGGEVLNSMGDGLLLCFPSAVQAVACALQIQSEFGQRRSNPAPDQALQHRMGVHIGDVFRQEDGGVAGDGVNIAARLEGKAPAGGVCVSQMVYDTVKGKVPMQAVFIGPELFKNITQPIPIWHIASEGAATLSRPPIPVAATQLSRVRTLTLIAAALATLASAGWWIFQQTKTPPPVAPRLPAPADAKKSAPAPTANDKSVVVLPFENLSTDPANALLTEGLHAEVISNLQLISDLKVISRTRAIAFKGSTASNAEIAQTLGVANVITGSVQREQGRVRIQLELRRASDDALLWSLPQGDRDAKDALALQTEIAEQVALALQARDTKGGASTFAKLMTRNPRAYELWVAARKLPPNERIAQCEEILRLDPNFMRAASLLSTTHNRLAGTSSESVPAERLRHAAEAKHWAEEASRMAPGGSGDGALAYYYFRIERDGRRSLAFAENLIRALPYDAEGYSQAGLALVDLGRCAESAAQYRHAIELDPESASYAYNLAGAVARLRRWEELKQAVAEMVAKGTPDDRHSADSDHFASTGELPVSLEGISTSDRLLWLWRGRRFAEMPALIDAELGNPQLSDARRWALRCTQVDVYLRLGQSAEATAAAREALVVAERLQSGPEIGPTEKPGWLAAALVRNGRTEEGIAAAQRAVAAASPDSQVLLRWKRETALAKIYAYTQHPRECVALLASLLREPCELTVPMLRVEPDWDNVREDAGFKALLADPKNSAPL